MQFINRSDAARQLIPQLERYANNDVALLAIPRGAVPMGRIIADYYHWPLTIALVKKIGHPSNPEFAIGAVGLDSVFLDGDHPDISREDLDHAVAHAQMVLRDRAKLFLGDRPPIVLRDRTVLIVDDGIATGSTLRAAIRVLRVQQPRRIVVVAPVSSSTALEDLRNLADEVIVSHSSPSFASVGEFYTDFPQVSDADVVEALKP